MGSSAALVTAAFVIVGSGCGGDDSASPERMTAGADATDTDVPMGATEDAPTGPGETTGQPPSETGLGSQGSSDTDTQSGTDTETGADQAAEPCSEIDCGAHGICETDVNGHASCACDADYASIGLECVLCEAVDGGTYSPNVMTAIATVIPLINGDPPPPSHNNDANLVLRSLDSGDEVQLGSTHAQQLEQSIVPGRYEVFYEFESGGELVPVNRRARLGIYEIDDAMPLELDIAATGLPVEILINGAEPPNDPQRFGEVYLVNPATGDEALLGNTVMRGEFITNVIPGTYDIHYRVKKAGLGVPANVDAIVERNFVVPFPDEVTLPLIVDLPMARIDGAISIAGNTPPMDPLDFGRLELIDNDTGSRTPLADTLAGTYAQDVIEADYRVLYRAIRVGAVVPGNKAAILPDVRIDARGGVSQPIEIEAIAIAGSITLGGGGAPDPSGSERANLFLRNLDSGDEVSLGDTLNASYGATVIPGEYGVFYSQVSVGATMPVNTNALLRDLKVGVDGQQGETINIPVVLVRGDFSVGGEDPPDSAYDDGRVFLHEPRSGDTALLGNTRQGSFSTLVVAGEYEAVYAAELSDGLVPLNKFTVIDPIREWGTNGNTGHSVDVSLAIVDGTIRLASGSPSASPGVGSLYLENLDAADAIYLGHTGSPAFERALTGGKYLVRYRAVPTPDGQLSEQLPANRNAALSCIAVGTP